MKSIYNEYGLDTEISKEIEKESIPVIAAIFKKYVDMGYSYREICEMLVSLVTIESAGIGLDMKQKEYLDRRNQCGQQKI